MVTKIKFITLYINASEKNIKKIIFILLALLNCKFAEHSQFINELPEICKFTHGMFL